MTAAEPPRSYTWLAIAIVIAALVISASLFIAVGGATRTTTFTSVVTGLTSSVTSTVIASSTITSTVFLSAALVTINATFVSRFCSNTSAIPQTGDQAQGMQLSGGVTIGPSYMSAGWTNTGPSAVTIQAICIDGIGIVPANDTSNIKGSTATALQLTISPGGLIPKGGQATVSATFRGGTSTYYMPQGGIGITVIASDGSSVSMTEPRGGGFLTTAEAQVPFASIGSVTLTAGNHPVLHAALLFNSTVSPIRYVDIFINGTYVGTVGISSSTGTSGLFVSLTIDEPASIMVTPGDRYTVTFAAATSGYYETRVSTTVAATPATTSTTATLVTGTSSTVTPSDTYLSSCSVTGIGGFQLRIVSGSTGAPVTGENVNAVDRLGCDSETQVVYLDTFSVGQGGWLTPIFPSQAPPGGQLSFIVTYQGQTYSFSAEVPPIGTNCVTLLVPSGSVQTTTTMNGTCS